MSDTDKNQMLVGAKKYSHLIPQKYRSKPVEKLFITTYTLELGALKTFLGNLIKDDIIELEDLDKNIQIYYDSLRLKHDCNNFLPKERYHEIKRTKGKHNFHPKIVLLDYGKENGFVIIVSSKNISSSNAIEAYAVAHDNGETDDKEHNGKAVADFFGSFTKLEESVRERLEKTNFVMGDGENSENSENVGNISFLTGREVCAKLEQKDVNNLVIVSPFVNMDKLNDLDKNIQIYSQEAPIKGENDNGKVQAYSKNFKEKIHSKIY